MVRKEKIMDESDVKEEDMDTSTIASTVRLPAVEKEEYARLSALVNSIANPLAGRKLAKKIYKLLKSVKNSKDKMRSGLGDVMKGFRKNETGIVVLAGDVWPIDMYSHIPALCEERQIPYVFTPSRQHLGLAIGFTRPFIVVMIKRDEEYGEIYDEIAENIKRLDMAVC